MKDLRKPKGGNSADPRYVNVIEYLSIDTVSRALKLDAQTCTLDPKLESKSFVQANKDQAYVFVNTWLHMAYDIAGQYLLPVTCYAQLRMASTQIASSGIYQTLVACNNSIAACLLGDELPGKTTLFEALFIAMGAQCEVQEYPDFFRDCYQLLKFGQRFTFCGATAILQSGLDAFIKRERINARWNVRNYYPSTIISRASDIVAEMFCRLDRAICTGRYDRESWPHGHGAFSSGSCNFGSIPKGNQINPPRTWSNSSRGKKYIACVGDYAIIPLDYTCVVPGDNPASFSRIRAVPKSYKTPRIIAMEHPKLGWHAFKLRESLIHAVEVSPWSKCFSFNDQSVNMYFACSGSVNGELATLDLSQASDSIYLALGAALFQKCPHVWAKLLENRSDRLSCNGLKYKWQEENAVTDQSGFKHYGYDNTAPTQMVFTSGSQLTPVFQSVVFMALCQSTAEIASCFTHGNKPNLHVYNDDIIIDSCLAQSVIDVLESLGFEVSISKSYLNTEPMAYGFFRESCGGDYLNGQLITPLYWPRHTINLDASGVASLCRLQHSLYYKAPSASAFISQYVRQIAPWMSSEPAGTVCDDLWDVSYDAPTGLPYGEPKTSQAYAYAERHKVWTIRNKVTADVQGVDTHFVQQAEMAMYMEFLMHGPHYSSPLDELLGVTSRVTLEEFVGSSEEDWTQIWV